MPVFDDAMFEHQYKEFLKVKTDWLELVGSLAVHHSKNSRDELIRPVAFSNDESDFYRAIDLHIRWKKFAEMADERRKKKSIAIPASLYSPVPLMVIEPERFGLTTFNATTTTTNTREDILQRYEKQKLKLKKIPYTADSIKALDEEAAWFAALPEGRLFRCRTSGYEDTIAEIIFKGEQESHKTRYGVHGVFVYHPNWTKENIIIQEGPSIEYSGKYDLISPVKCSLFPGSKLYDIEDINIADKKAQQRAIVDQAIHARRYNFERRAKSRMIRAETQEKAEIVAGQIEQDRQNMMRLNEMDLQLLDRKFASGNLNVLKMTELREMYGEKQSRRGKKFKELAQRG
ncbi:hypothetical protein [Atlantibacter hermannii]|uniref:hypothetical protein n=1 Tax=Atlantibacter hermannii TaxID=565 RepID=UPI00289BD538|nr:hypothetical protein [Atlantibacter hermannii]